MLRISQIIAPSCLIVAVAACGPTQEDKVTRAEEAIAQHRFNDARLDLGSVIADRPSDSRLLELLARVQLHLGDGTGAAATLQRLAALGDTPADMQLMRAEADLLRGQYESARSLADELESAEAARIAALASIGLDEIEAAEARFASGMQRTGEQARLHSEFALFRMRQGQLEEAANLAELALAAGPDELDPLIASARVAQAQRRADDALRFFVRAQESWPESRAALLGRIGVLGDLGRIEEARVLIDQAAASLPGEPSVVYLQARLAAEDGKWQQVRELLQPLEDGPEAAHRQLYARALVELELFEQARSRLTPMLREYPRSTTLRRLMGRAMIGSGEPQQAMDVLAPLARSAEGAPEDVALYAEAARLAGQEPAIADLNSDIAPPERIARLLSQADAALREGKWRTAIDSYERIRQWTGDSNALVLNNLAYARSRTGETQQAIALAERAHGLAPRNPSVKDTLGWLLWQSGTDRARGLQLLVEAAALAPDNDAIARHLEQARRS